MTPSEVMSARAAGFTQLKLCRVLHARPKEIEHDTQAG
jgi:hypothetical protein